MLKTVYIYLTGGENAGWALDADAQQLQSALRNIEGLTLVPIPEDADVIYSVWWEALAAISAGILSRKYVICNMCSRPFQTFTNPRFSMFLQAIDLVVAQSIQALDELHSVGVNCVYAPYAIDAALFSPLEQPRQLRGKYHLPQDAYIVGNFHRDSEGANLALPKLTKGPDILFEMIQLVWKTHKNLHLLLAGPRRHWLREQLERRQIPYTFVGKITHTDDWEINILPLPQINELYQCLDLAIVSSRHEGAPRTLLEAAATKTKVISTNVGIAADVLTEHCVYANFVEGAQLIRRDIEARVLDKTTTQHYATVVANHTTTVLTRHLQQIFATHVIPNLPCHPPKTLPRFPNPPPQKRPLQIGIWHKFFKPPYG